MPIFRPITIVAGIVAAAALIGAVQPAMAGVTYSGCKALLEHGHGGRVRIGGGQSGTFNNVLNECRKRFGSQLNAHARKRRENRQESVRVLTETLTGLETMKPSRRHRRDHVKERADRNYRDAEALLRGVMGVEQRRNPWDSVRSHKKKGGGHY